MTKFTVQVSQLVEVELDETKFTEQFMSEFRESFYSYYTLEEHAEHIAQLIARGVIETGFGGVFIEGYGPCAEMGIDGRVIDTEMELMP